MAGSVKSGAGCCSLMIVSLMIISSKCKGRRYPFIVMTSKANRESRSPCLSFPFVKTHYLRKLFHAMSAQVRAGKRSCYHHLGRHNFLLPVFDDLTVEYYSLLGPDVS